MLTHVKRACRATATAVWHSFELQGYLMYPVGPPPVNFLPHYPEVLETPDEH